MLAVLLKLIDAFSTEIGKRLATRLSDRLDVCRSLLRLYVSLEELQAAAVAAYEDFEHYVSRFDELNVDGEFKLRLRTDVRALLEALKRFEEYMRRVFVKLDLLDDSDASLKLALVPESSYALFKKYLVEDLAPQVVANRQGTKYLLRLVTAKSSASLVNVNRLGHISVDLDSLFEEKVLVYELVDFDIRHDIAKVLEDCAEELLALNAAREALKALLRKNCDLHKVL